MALHNDIIAAIEDAVRAHYQGDPLVTAAEVDKVVEAQAYAFEIGTLVVNQNPYAPADRLELPEIYPEGTGETRLIRKTGVLREFHAAHPLPDNVAIPGGFALPFHFEGRASLEDDGTGEAQGPIAGDSVSAVVKYVHNIIKIVRLRYSMLNRTSANGEHSKGYVLICFSGGDT